MSTALREYRRALALAAMDHATEPVTAGELTEMMGLYAQAEGHPPHCWRSLNGSEVSGVLRTLEGDGSVVRAGGRRDGRAGRDAPLWRLSGHMRGEVSHVMAMPSVDDLDEEEEELPLQASAPPASVPPAPAEEPSPYGGMNRLQLYALLEVGDRLAGVQARHMRELQDTTSWARAKLAEVGLG